MDQWIRRVYVIARTYKNCLRLLGGAGLALLIRSWLGLREARCVSVDGQPVWVRPGTTDLATLLQIFWNREYEFELAREPSVIIDAGANVGYSSLYFANRYPAAQIIAVEPHPENFAQLERHAAEHPRIHAVQAALWHEDTSLGLWDPHEGHWGFRVVAADDTDAGVEIQGVSVSSLMARFELDRIDVLKLDVEGSELEIFEHSAPWIDAVGVLVAELHDKYRVGCARAFYTATQAFPHERRLGENILMLRDAYLAPGAEGA